MRDVALDNLIKLAVYAAAVTLLAVCISPVVFQGGKALAEVSLGRPTNRAMDWFANWANGAGFHEFFVLTFLGFSVLLLPLLVDRIGVAVVPARALFCGNGPWHAQRSGLLGFLMVFTAGSAVAWWCGGEWPAKGTIRVFLKACMLAFAFEWIFRGMLFGMLEKLWGSVMVVALSAATFAGFRLILPPPDFTYGDPESWTLGWQMIGKLAWHFPATAFTVLPLLGWGVLLGLARLRDQSLWPPVFLHAGWLVAAGIFHVPACGWISWGALCAGFGWFWFVRVRRVSDEEN